MNEFMGMMKEFAGPFPPQDYMFCEGQLLPESNFSTLFQVFGHKYGGVRGSTFALPDMREVDPQTHVRHWHPGRPKWIICVFGLFPNRA
jgi:microcystin-dependent protein